MDLHGTLIRPGFIAIGASCQVFQIKVSICQGPPESRADTKTLEAAPLRRLPATAARPLLHHTRPTSLVVRACNHCARCSHRCRCCCRAAGTTRCRCGTAGHSAASAPSRAPTCVGRAWTSRGAPSSQVGVGGQGLWYRSVQGRPCSRVLVARVYAQGSGWSFLTGFGGQGVPTGMSRGAPSWQVLVANDLCRQGPGPEGHHPVLCSLVSLGRVLGHVSKL